MEIEKIVPAIEKADKIFKYLIIKNRLPRQLYQKIWEYPRQQQTDFYQF